MFGDPFVSIVSFIGPAIAIAHRRANRTRLHGDWDAIRAAEQRDGTFAARERLIRENV